MIDLVSVAKSIQRRMVGENPRIAIILGSGLGSVLGSVAEQIEDPIVIPYSEIDGIPRSTVEGHSGRLVIGALATQHLTHDETLAEGARAANIVTRLITLAVKTFDEADC